MKNYPYIAARIFNTPLLIHPQKLDAIISGLGSRLLGREGEAIQIVADESPSMFSTRPAKSAESGLYRIDQGVAVINVDGALVHRSQFVMADSSYLLGYNEIATALEEAMSNPDVHAVLQVYSSPGGEVQGAFEYAQRVFDLRGKKPMYAIADGMAASAAYLGGSAADRLYTTVTGYSGSVGVVMRHVDFSQALAADGIAVTQIFAGAHKVDGNQFEPLPASVRADFQAEVESLYSMFVDAVSRHVGMDPAAVRKTQAQTYRGQAAVDAGLAYGVTTTDQLIAELAALRSVRSYGLPAQATATDKGATMSGTSSPAGNAQPVITQADVDRARAEGHAAGVAEGMQAGIESERARVAGIHAHPEAVGRAGLVAQCIALGVSVDQAGTLLAATPKEAAGKDGAPSAFAAAMAAVGNPPTRPDSEQRSEPQAESDLVNNMLALFQGKPVR